MFVSLTVDAAVDCQSVTDCDVEESAPAPYWPCHIPLSPMLQYICPPPIHPSTHSFPFMCLPPDFKCLSLHFLQAPPPPDLVATETADSGRVGGCLRALAALPHAVLSQYISASVLLLWPWYADSSGGSVRCYTIVSGTQRLFVPFPQRTWWVFRVVLPFTSVFPQMTEQTEEKRLTNHRCWEVFLYKVLLCWICAHIIYVSDVNAWLLTGLIINCWADPVRP